MINFVTLLFCVPSLLLCGAMFAYGTMKRSEPDDYKAWMFFIVLAVITTCALAVVMYT